MAKTSADTPFTITYGPQRHAMYAELAATAPAHRILLPIGEPAWLITGYKEARHALQDSRLVKSKPTAANVGCGLLPPDVFAAMESHMLNRDSPDHARLRRLITAAFTRRRIEQLKPRVQQIADDLLNAMANETQVDLIHSFALPLPITVICELLGVPADRREKFHDWSSIVLTGMLARPDVFVTAATAMVSYLRELVDTKRTGPADDLLSVRLSEDELTSMVFLILVAGHETTVNLIGNGVLALLNDPTQLALLRAQPDRLPQAVEELLRFDGPLQVATFRITAEPVDIGGITIPAGDTILVGLLAANRDPACTAQCLLCGDILTADHREQ